MDIIRQSYKNDIRKNIKRIRDRLSDSFVRDNSKLISDKVFSLNAIKEASVVLTYYSINNEVNTHEIIEKLTFMNKKVALPICRPDKTDLAISIISSTTELKPGSFGIMEPDPDNLSLVKPEEIDIVLVPGIAFDRRGNRIGYGKGYYDRFLQVFKPSQLKIGLCFDFQLFDELPSDSNDVPVDCIITESSVIGRCK
jgi:5-formyltetrahydrofolate cyclo-ligase